MMCRLPHRIHGLLAVLGLVLLASCQSPPKTAEAEGGPELQVHYVEIVSETVDTQRKVLEAVHGLSFGPEVQDLGGAQVAETATGVLVGVRAPLAEHEQPIVRLYFAVDDIQEAVKAAEAAGAVIAYPPTTQGETGTWAIYILEGIQYGLWQQ
jgi:predicted enzyme related to lactoylglutathione lyase